MTDGGGPSVDSGPGDGSGGDAGDGGPTIMLKATIPLPIPADGGGGVNSIAFDLTHQTFWVATYGNSAGGVFKIDATNNQVSGPVSGTDFGELVVVPSRNKVYQRNFSFASPRPLATVIDGATNAVTTTVTSTKAGFPQAIAADKKNGKVYVLQTGASSFVDVVDATTDTVVQSLEITATNLSGSALAVDPMNGSVYVLGTIPDSSPAGKSVNVVTLTGSPLTVGPTTKVGPNADSAGFTAVPGSYVVALRDDATNTRNLYVGTTATALPFVPFTVKAYTSEGAVWRIAVGGADETGGFSAAKPSLAVADATGNILASFTIPGAPQGLGIKQLAPVDAVDDTVGGSYGPDTYDLNNARADQQDRFFLWVIGAIATKPQK